jgi:hypothetical protein
MMTSDSGSRSASRTRFPSIGWRPSSSSRSSATSSDRETDVGMGADAVAGRFLTSRLGGLEQKCPVPCLAEVVIRGQGLGQTSIPHDDEADAVGQAPSLVQPAILQVTGTADELVRHRRGIHSRAIREPIEDRREARPVTALSKRVAELADHRESRHDRPTCRPDSLVPAPGGWMVPIRSVHKCDHKGRVKEEDSPHRTSPLIGQQRYEAVPSRAPVRALRSRPQRSIATGGSWLRASVAARGP